MKFRERRAYTNDEYDAKSSAIPKTNVSTAIRSKRPMSTKNCAKSSKNNFRTKTSRCQDQRFPYKRFPIPFTNILSSILGIEMMTTWFRITANEWLWNNTTDLHATLTTTLQILHITRTINFGPDYNIKSWLQSSIWNKIVTKQIHQRQLRLDKSDPARHIVERFETQSQIYHAGPNSYWSQI